MITVKEIKNGLQQGRITISKLDDIYIKGTSISTILNLLVEIAESLPCTKCTTLLSDGLDCKHCLGNGLEHKK